VYCSSATQEGLIRHVKFDRVDFPHVANRVDYRYLCPVGVAQIREAIGQAGAKVKQCAFWFSGHAGIAIGGARDHAFEETEHTTHFHYSVKSGDNVDF
jgi:hypothetical protein